MTDCTTAGMLKAVIHVIFRKKTHRTGDIVHLFSKYKHILNNLLVSKELGFF